jgi:hypothetical protein
MPMHNLVSGHVRLNRAFHSLLDGGWRVIRQNKPSIEHDNLAQTRLVR